MFSLPQVNNRPIIVRRSMRIVRSTPAACSAVRRPRGSSGYRQMLYGFRQMHTERAASRDIDELSQTGVLRRVGATGRAAHVLRDKPSPRRSKPDTYPP
jgi:hypothetical protein